MGALVRSAASQMQINEVKCENDEPAHAVDVQTHAQMHSLNFFFNYCNSTRSRQLQEEYALVKQDIREGQAMLVKMQQQSAIQSEAISSLTQSVDMICEPAHSALSLDSLFHAAEGVEHQRGRLDNLTQTVDEQVRLCSHRHSGSEKFGLRRKKQWRVRWMTTTKS